MTEFERVVLSGTPRERGIEHGERFAEEVAANVETYRERFSHEGVDVDAMRNHAAEYVEYIERESPEYAAEMRGIAEGSGVPLVDVTMLNVRWEVIYPAWKAQTEKENEAATTGTVAEPEPPVDGCTSFGVMPSATADGTTYMGQNWDWLAPIEDTLFLMELRRDDAPDVLAMTEAGIVGGKIGVNEHGIGIAVNGLISADDGSEGFRKPYHVRFREVLDADRYDDALRPILETDRVCSANVLVGHADGELIDLEAAPELVNPIHPDEGVLTHSNHFETDAVESVNERRGPSTLYRAERLRRLLAAEAAENVAAGDDSTERGIDSEAIRDSLRDHFGRPSSICSHVDESLPEVEHGQTNASLVIDLQERRILGQRGPPCEGEYHEYAL
ncbi:isopenicillin-N N-acyltransferase like protein [Halorubrum aquaticum]|uniref:Isopenicillin-N N-acyltransferase like protein n=1 Tax=Halorubrum aquaticum TaxID=387340 RepID=A0A1I2Z8P8_9EURY|nr:C45 family peptidase [Halorubrum aquaticum]SFH34217.1 isopenicillin-N N-acyltransferase like protein [Halorubrum aquaticum]